MCQTIQSHSNHPWEPVHALYSTAALQSKLQKALLVTTSTPMGFCSLYSPTVTQHRVTATILGTLCMLSAALLLFKASCKQPCWSQLLHLWVLQFIQPCSEPIQSHSNHPWEPVHALCSTAALQSKLQTALLVQLLQLWALQVIQPYSDPTQSHNNHPWDPVHALCSTAALQSKLQTALLVTPIAPLGLAVHTAVQ